MLAKTIEVDVVKSTFPNAIIPAHLVCPQTVSIDVADALLMLGQLTSPSGFSTASPTRYWTWLRYFSAISSTSDLRITAPFIDLDPHQKTILSDDFGVAMSTQWLYDRLGGFAEIVDGRRFMLQYASLIHRPKRKLPKVGIGKCPDFVVRDFANRWHVLECKGTQSSRAYRNQQLNSAYMQKKVIDVRGAASGDRLAAGIYFGNERYEGRTHLRVIDPEVKPYVVINESDREIATTATQQLAISRALALAGFDAVSEELSLPSEVDGLEELYTTVERSRLNQPTGERWSYAMKSFKPAERRQFDIGTERFVGQETTVLISGDDFQKNTQCTRVKLSQGINASFIEELLSTGANRRPDIGSLGEEYLRDSNIKVQTAGLETTLYDGNLYAARMEFLP